MDANTVDWNSIKTGLKVADVCLYAFEDETYIITKDSVFKMMEDKEWKTIDLSPGIHSLP